MGNYRTLVLAVDVTDVPGTPEGPKLIWWPVSEFSLGKHHALADDECWRPWPNEWAMWLDRPWSEGVSHYATPVALAAALSGIALDPPSPSRATQLRVMLHAVAALISRPNGAPEGIALLRY